LPCSRNPGAAEAARDSVPGHWPPRGEAATGTGRQQRRGRDVGGPAGRSLPHSGGRR
jgi:hypothetical protein